MRELLGRPRFIAEAAERTAVPGVATGLAVTGAGGDVLFIEATAMDGEPGLTLTGQLGDVMKESASIALSYVRSHAAEFDDRPGGSHRDFHVHVPAGAVPKDGPSAGITMTDGARSLLTGRPVQSDVGMTGEVTLQGRVLPIGGRQAEGARRASGRAHRRHPPGAQRARPRRRAGVGARRRCASTRCTPSKRHSPSRWKPLPSRRCELRAPIIAVSDRSAAAITRPQT